MINDLTITQEDFASLSAFHSASHIKLDWNLVFTLPEWLKVWWQNFGSGAELYIRAVKYQGEVIGISPLQIRDGTASIIGSVNVCDYQDFIIAPGRENDFFKAILDDLIQKGIRNVNLETIRPDSKIVTHLVPLAQARGYKIDYRQVDVSADLDLPSGWEEYLGILDGKQRHELRRKMRNLQEAGETAYYTIEDKSAIPEATEKFLRLFPESRSDKAQFMTMEMQIFFRSMAEAMGETGIIRFGVLEILKKPVAMIIYFDYNNNIYLYNSAYDPAYKSMSVGIISKANSIQESIKKGKRKYDFLKGSEKYKYYLGGKEIPLYRCEILLNNP